MVNKLIFSVILLTLAIVLTTGLLGLAIFKKSEVNIDKPILGCGVTDEFYYGGSNPKILNLPGRMVFESNCQVCHRLNEKLVGPALHDIFERRDSLWIVKHIKNAEKHRDSGDSLAIQIYEDYYRIEHTAFEKMPDSTLVKLVTYLIEEGK